MALETLQGVTEIGGFKVLQERPKKRDGSVDWDLFDEQRKINPIYVDHEVNMISFRIQNGPIKEVGVNGCKVETMIEAAKMLFEKLNEILPSRENAMVITKLDEALLLSLKRKLDREQRQVEGYNKV
jgi:hypothetical protein